MGAQTKKVAKTSASRDLKSLRASQSVRMHRRLAHLMRELSLRYTARIVLFTCIPAVLLRNSSKIGLYVTLKCACECHRDAVWSYAKAVRCGASEEITTAEQTKHPFEAAVRAVTQHTSPSLSPDPIRMMLGSRVTRAVLAVTQDGTATKSRKSRAFRPGMGGIIVPR